VSTVSYVLYGNNDVEILLRNLRLTVLLGSLSYIFNVSSNVGLREERGLRVFGNRVLRRVFGPKRYEVTGEWRKLHNEELNDLYSLPNIVRLVKSKRMRWAGHVTLMGRREG
jgi:hypothetical protein